MNDKELLERAAKAAGYCVSFRDDMTMKDGEAVYYLHDRGHPQKGREGNHWWNPLADDGDALRLAVRLKIEVMFTPHRERSIAILYNSARPVGEDHDGDPYAATRRAIVRAAAALVEPTSPQSR